MHAAKSLVARHSGVVRMARHLHLMFFRHGHYALQEIRDPFPHGVLAHGSGLGQRRILLRLIVDEGAVARSTAPAPGPAAYHAENRKVVLHGWNAGAGA